MRRRIAAVLVLALAVTFAPPLRPTAAETEIAEPAAVTLHRPALVKGVESTAAGLRVPAETRELGYVALADLAVSANATRALGFLRRQIATQRADGTLPWTEPPGDVVDNNATAFGTQAWGPILLRYDGRLDAPTRAALKRASARAIPALEAYAIPVSYTNIALIAAVDVLLMGDALGDESAVRWANRRLDALVSDVAARGIHEYNSPNYYGADFDALALGAALTTDATARATLRALVAYFWSDVTAHVVGDRTGGASSRDYDFIGQTLGLNRLLQLGGLIPETSRDERIAPREILHLFGLDELRRLPDGAKDSIARTRVSQGRYGPSPDDAWYAFAGLHVLLGSADGNYFNQDKPVAVTFADRVNGMAIIPESNGDLYGLGLVQPNGSRGRPAHLLMNPATIQSGKTLVAAIDLDAKEIGVASEVLTNVVLPASAAASVTVDDRPVDLLHDQVVALTTRSVVVVRTKTAAAAVRVTSVDGIAGQRPTIALISDGAGRRLGSARITLRMYRGAPQRPAAHTRATFVFAVDDDRDAPLGTLLAAATLDTRFDDREHLTADVGGKRFAMTIDPTTRRAVERSVDAVPIVVDQPLSIDGKRVPLVSRP